MRNELKFLTLAAALFGLAASNALAGDLGLVVNGDIEEVTRFLPHGVDDVPDGHPGFPDGWHHSANSTWSNGTTDPFVSSSHSLNIPDNRLGDHDEMRSFGLPLPGVGNAGRTLDLSWKWNWDITSTAGDRFSATVRTSTQPAPDLVSGYDLQGNNDSEVQIRDHAFFTDGTANSGGFQMFMESIPLLATEQSFDIIFRTRDNEGDSSELGTLFVDDVTANVVPEPGSLLLLSIGGIMALGRRSRK